MSDFTGLLAYPITPLSEDGGVDVDGLAGLVKAAAEAGVDGVTVLGSSGDGSAFRTGERDAVVRAAIDAAGALPVYVAVSAPSTWAVEQIARAAETAGAAGLVLAPFAYVPLVDAEVVALVRAVDGASGLPLCFYNKPWQTGHDVPAAVLARLARTTRLRAVKDPASLPERPRGRLRELREAAAIGDEASSFSVGLSMDAALTGDAPVADAWHTGLAALLPNEYVAIRRARSAVKASAVEAVATSRPATDEPATAKGAAPSDRDLPVRVWLHEIAIALATMRPVSGLHALAGLLGTPTAPPRGPSLPASGDQVRSLRTLVERRPSL